MGSKYELEGKKIESLIRQTLNTFSVQGKLNKTKKAVIFQVGNEAHDQRRNFPEFKISEVAEL